MFGMRRREFVALLGSTAVGWPLTVRAQQPERARRVGVLMSGNEVTPEQQARVAAFRAGLQKLGWTDGANVQLPRAVG